MVVKILRLDFGIKKGRPAKVALKKYQKMIYFFALGFSESSGRKGSDFSR